MNSAMHVYVGDYGNYAVPDGLLMVATTLNGAKRLTDKRTRGAKLINAWGLLKDAEQCQTLTTQQ